MMKVHPQMEARLFADPKLPFIDEQAGKYLENLAKKEPAMRKTTNEVVTLKEPQPTCYHCGKNNEESGNSQMQLVSATYSQTFCLECYGMMLEHLSRSMP